VFQGRRAKRKKPEKSQVPEQQGGLERHTGNNGGFACDMNKKKWPCFSGQRPSEKTNGTEKKKEGCEFVPSDT